MLLVDCPLCDQPSPLDGDALDCDACGVLEVAPDAEAVALPLAA
jgi:hypothetical protein